MEGNLRPDKGLIGLTSLPFKIGSTKLLFPFGASQALPLYGKGYNFSFQVYDPGREYSYDDYTEHVVNFFDADWCLKNNIRVTFTYRRGTYSPIMDCPAHWRLACCSRCGLFRPLASTRFGHCPGRLA